MPDDFSEIDTLVADLRAAAKVAPGKARQIVQQVGMKTKKFWQGASSNPAGRQYTATIDYELEGLTAAGEITVHIGPDLARYGGKTGKGGLIPSFGIFDDPLSTGRIRVAPDRARRKAREFAADDVEKGLSIALDQILSARGL